ncbi:MAG: hypothetical protein WCR45_07090 [Bacteroidaceae bacterium]|nr:hypothetical protein [Bacteroidaceae bacterium]
MEQKCDNCSLKARYDKNAKSFLGKLWRWHINFCPGWKAYFASCSPEEQEELRKKYNFKKYK